MDDGAGHSAKQEEVTNQNHSVNPSRNRAMTESPRPPLMPKTRSGFRNHTSPNQKLSKRLGASLPNLDQPLNDAMASFVFSSHRAPAAQKMSPDAGRCR